MARNVKLRYKLLLLLASILSTLLVLEGAYRVKIYLTLPRGRDAVTLVYGNSPYVYDRDFGYRYAPSMKTTMVNLSEGRVTSIEAASINADGNVGALTKASQDWQSADLSILVFGDSFTAGPFSGITWTDRVPVLIQDRAGKRVALLNYGRDGYGIMQMLDLAVRTIPKYRPDLVIFAFISADLMRGRRWIKTFTAADASDQDVFTATDPSRCGMPGASLHALLGHPQLDLARARRLLAEGGSDDPILRQVFGNTIDFSTASMCSSWTSSSGPSSSTGSITATSSPVKGWAGDHISSSSTASNRMPGPWRTPGLSGNSCARAALRSWPSTCQPQRTSRRVSTTSPLSSGVCSRASSG